MAKGSLTVIVAASLLLCMPLVGSEDLYWRPNTDWNNPSNWKLGRVPCEADVADFSAVPRGSKIKLGNNTTVRSIILPLNSTIVLSRSLTIRFSNKTSCKINTGSGPMVAPVKENNTFIGAGPKFWENAKNWQTGDGTVAKNSPCGKDGAVFREDHYYWTVESNFSKVSVQSLHVRGEKISTNQISKVAPELKLNLAVDPRCDEDPTLCPCLSGVKPLPDPPSPSQSPHSPSQSPLSPSPGARRKKRNDDDSTTAAVVVVVLVVLLLLIGLTILLIVLWLRWKRANYNKDELLGNPDDSLHSTISPSVSSNDGVLFDNPVYETGGGRGGGKKGKNSAEMNATKPHEMVAILRSSTDQYEPVNYPATTAMASGRKKKVPLSDEYEQLA